jgi:hypothetical protein
MGEGGRRKEEEEGGERGGGREIEHHAGSQGSTQGREEGDWEEGKGEGEEGKRGRGEEGKRGRGEEGKRERGRGDGETPKKKNPTHVLTRLTSPWYSITTKITIFGCKN